MKNLRTLSNLWVTDLRKITGVLIIALGLGVGLWSVTADNDKDKDHGNSDKHGDQGKNDDKDHGKGKGDDKDHGNSNGNGQDKCIVCHNDHNFHEISIPCDQVDKYLEHHPGDHAGPCNVTSVTNP